MDAWRLKEVLQQEMEIPSGVDLVVPENNSHLLLFLQKEKQVFSFSLNSDWTEKKITDEAKGWLKIKVGA